MNNIRYTPELIEARKADVKEQIRKTEERMGRRWRTITEQPPAENKAALLMNRVAAAYTLFDGVRTGYRLIRALGLMGRGRQKKK